MDVLHDIGSYLSDSIFVVDQETGKVLDANDAACQSLQYTLDELRELTVMDLDTRFSDFSYWQRSVRTLGGPGVALGRHRRKDGSTYPVEVKSRRLVVEGSPMVVAVCRDMTARTDIEDALYESEARFRAVFEHSSDPIFLCDIDADEIREANPRAVELWGYSRAELLARPFTSLIAPESIEVVRRVRRELQSGPCRSYEVVCVARDGRRIVAEASSSLVERSGRRIAICLYRDVTQRKELELELKHQSEKLAQSNAELARFAAVAAHDLQAPLRRIISFTQLLGRKLGNQLDSESRELFGFLTQGAEQMQRLIRDLLTYARTDANPALGEVDANEVMAEVLLHHSVAIDETKARIEVAPLPFVKMARSHLLQLLQNLTGNALKFGRDGTPLSIRIAARTEANAWIFSVEDNGTGIAESDRTAIFEPFVRLDGTASRPGSGLGLTTCRRIVDHYQGRLWLTSRIGKGSTFFFSIPRGVVGKQ